MRIPGFWIAGAIVVWWTPSLAQTCHDWDADGAPAGWQCIADEDCADRSWQRHPGAPDVCDGIENDCDGNLDLGCDRFCEQPTLFGQFAELPVKGLEALSACAVPTDLGFLAGSMRITGSDRAIHVRAHDRMGAPWGPATAVGEPGPANPDDRYCELADAGDRAIVSWIDAHTRDQNTFVMKARVVDAVGGALGPGPLDLSASSPVEGTPWLYHSPLWDGERFVIFWAPAFDTLRHNLLMSVVNPDGTLGSPATVIVTGDVDGRGSTIQWIRAVWTGHHFVVVVSHDMPGLDPNIVSLRISRDGVLLARSGIPAHGAGLRVAQGSDRIAVVLADQSATSLRVRAAFVDTNGTYLSTPGIVVLRLQGNDGTNSGNLRVTWTGEMFGIAWGAFAWRVNDYVYDWYLWRLMPNGDVLDPGGLLLANQPTQRDVQALHWAGRDFWLFAIREDPSSRLVRQRIVCSCADEDGDTFDACAELDCDDGDPEVNLFSSESCRGLKDDDCDGLVDCDDPDCPAAVGPLDVTDLKWSGAALSWSASPGAERYDLARGLLSDLRRRSDLLQAECAGPEMVGTTWVDDARVPPPGDGLWYLIRAEGAPCALGVWGDAGPSPRQLSACR